MDKRMIHQVQRVLFISTACVLMFSLYLQYMLAFQPCPLCIMQRIALCVLTLLFLVGSSWRIKKRRLGLLCAQLGCAALGLFFALRQMWLQSLPVEDTGICLPGLDLLIRYLPPREMLRVLFWGERSCGEVTWYGFGLSMATWSAFCFAAMILVLLYVIYRVLRQHDRV